MRSPVRAEPPRRDRARAPGTHAADRTRPISEGAPIRLARPQATHATTHDSFRRTRDRRAIARLDRRFGRRFRRLARRVGSRQSAARLRVWRPRHAPRPRPLVTERLTRSRLEVASCPLDRSRTRARTRTSPRGLRSTPEALEIVDFDGTVLFLNAAGVEFALELRQISKHGRQEVAPVARIERADRDA
jgi:hypothetical protein